MKKIKFLKIGPLAELEENFPAPAINNLPEDYKKMPPFVGKKEFTASDELNQTIKRCIPFLDAMSSGYVIKTPVDLWVEIKEDAPYIRWSVETIIVSTHDKKQIPESMFPDFCYDIPFKLINNFGIQTPPGYSTLFVPVLNSPNNPLVALSGVVDTDTYNSPVHFPFFLKSGFTGKIPSGTPIVQAIPFKRENWQSFVTESDDLLISKTNLRIKSNLEFAYKKFFWKRKQYK